MNFYKIEESNIPIPKRGEKIPIVDFLPDRNEIYFKGKKIGTAELFNSELINIDINSEFLDKYGNTLYYKLPYE